MEQLSRGQDKEAVPFVYDPQQKITKTYSQVST